MKKLLIVLATLLVILAGCGGETKKPSEPVVISPVDSFDVDMSKYHNMSSTNHQFMGITPQTFLDFLKNNGTGIVYVGYDTCPVCNQAVSIMNEVASELGVTIYYLDCYNPINPLIDYIDEFIAATRPILDVRDGEPVVLTPHLMTIVDGEFVDSEIGIGGLEPETNEDDYQKVKARYTEMMEYFKVD